MKKAQWLMKTKIGPLYFVASEKGLQGIFWKKQAVPVAASLNGKQAPVRILSKSVRQLEEYMDGKRRSFDLPLDVTGTSFQKSVWKELGKIPYGKTSSYKDVARGIRKPKAARAVGSANGKNPVCIVVPCHRVIANDGSIGGYAGGLGIKSKLLKLEAGN